GCDARRGRRPAGACGAAGSGRFRASGEPARNDVVQAFTASPYTVAMDETADYTLEIQIATRFLDEESAPDDDRYVFAYTIRIRNLGRLPAQLLARHWVITDANGK